MFKGVFTALVTPFTVDGNIDEKSLRDLVDFQITAGVDGLVSVGTTWESPTLSPEENEQIIRIVVDQAGARVPVIAGTGQPRKAFTATLPQWRMPLIFPWSSTTSRAAAGRILRIQPCLNLPNTKT